MDFQINLKEVKVEDGLDLRSIGRKLDGYSGADITNVCRDASMMSMRRKIAGLKPSEIKNLAKDELDMPVTKQVSSSLVNMHQYMHQYNMTTLHIIQLTIPIYLGFLGSCAEM